MKYLIYLILFISQFYNSFAQKYNFKTYGLEDGLVQSQIRAIIQDDDGYMWFGTFGGGISKFNGQTFSNYNSTDGIINNDINIIMKDKKGNLWFGTREGISKLYLNDRSRCLILKAGSRDPAFKIDTNNNVLCVENFSTVDGLPNNYIYSIFEDSKNNFWIGTRNGASRLSFKNNKPVFLNFNKNNGLADSIIYDIKEDKYGDIWFATGSGLSRLLKDYEEKLKKDTTDSSFLKAGSRDPAFKKEESTTLFENLTIDENKTTNKIFKLLIDNDGNIWCGTIKGLVVVIPKDHNSPIIFDHTISSFLKAGSRDPATYKIIKFPGDEGLADIYTRSMIESNQAIWIASSEKGLYQVTLDEEDKTIKILDYFTTHNGLPENQIWSLYEDREGNIWIGTSGGGVARYSGKMFEAFSTEDGLAHNVIWSILQDKNGSFWFRYYPWRGISVYDPKAQADNYTLQDRKKKKIIYYSKKEGLKHDAVMTWFKDSKGDIWVGYRAGGVSKISINNRNRTIKTVNPFGKNDSIADKLIYAISEDRSGAMWFAAARKLFKYKDRKFTSISKEDGLFFNSVDAILEDSKGSMWFLTREGVSRLMPGSDAEFSSVETLHATSLQRKTMNFKSYTIKEGLVTDYMIAIIEDNKGNIWLGGFGGVSVYNHQADTFYNFTVKDNLSSDMVYLIIQDDNGYIWIGTNKGIDRVSYEDGKITVKKYGKLEGFIGIETNSEAAYKDNEGNIWFGTIKGVTKYNPNEDKENTMEPLTHITGMRLFFEKVDWSDLADSLHPKTSFPVGLQLSYDQNHLTFDFIGISLTIPEKVKYQWKLEGFDEKWSPVTSKHEATYSYIPPGKYTFMVKACNNDGVWNRKPTTYKFTITPPFWQTWWFRVLSLASGVFAIMGYIKIRERNLKRAKTLLEQKVKQRTEQLNKQKEATQEKNQELNTLNEELRQSNEELNIAKEEIEQTNLKLNEANAVLEKLAIVASKTDNAVIIANKNGEIEWVNEALIRMTGFTLDEYKKEKGKTIQEASANPEIEDLIKECIEKRHSVVYEALNINKEGREIWVQTTLTPILDEAGKLRHLVAVDSDITELKKIQRDIEERNKLIEEKNSEILASIRYAANIQNAILPDIEEISEHLPEVFVFYRPKDIVSGDFYWFARLGKKSIIAVVDCTGHGVPGAFLSMVGNDLLNQIIIERKIENPSEILKKLHEDVVFALGQQTGDTSKTAIRDGMDMSLCTIDMERKEVCYAGAIRPLWLVRKQTKDKNKEQYTIMMYGNGYELIQIKGDRCGIGGIDHMERAEYNNHSIILNKGDSIYMSSDGYLDQFGGDRNKKYSRKRFFNFLLSIQDLSMKEQGQKMEKEFDNWKMEYEQTDDICVIGIRL